jgi:plastocyanin
VDPRKEGLEVGLGEWAVTPEFEPIRPGRVSFVITNRGTMQHGFEIALEGDSSGPGSGDRLKAESELLDPGQSDTVTLDLPPGVYKMECLVDGHDDLGMETMFAVRADAPLKKVEVKARDDGASSVSISNFAFEPGTVTVPAGTKVTWTNDDPTPHTVTSEDGSFDSGILDAGRSFTTTLSEPGTFAYRCQIHPEMQGTVEVTG